VTTPANKPDPLTEFSVSADRDGILWLEHYHPATGSCWWEVEVSNGTPLPELAERAQEHLAEKHGAAA